MRIKCIRLLKGCIALIITLTCLYIGQALWRNYAVDLPLDKSLNDIDSVEKVSLDDSYKMNDTIAIYVTLSNTDNLQKTHNKIIKTIDQTLKGSPYTFEIEDNRSPELEQAYYDIHHYIQKAIVDGDFPMLEVKVREKSDSIEASSKVYVDELNIYLQLAKNGNDLYAVVPRYTDKTGGNF